MSSKARRNRTKSGTSSAKAAAAGPLTDSESVLGSFKIPLALIVALAILALTPRVQSNDILFWSFIGAIVFLAAWFTYLLMLSRNSGEGRSFEVILRPQHYLQAMVQLSVYAYWGYYWRPVYDHAWLIVAQLLFAYAFDMMLAWSRRQKYTLGFGPFPIIFSINLFLWFRDDWFYMQFLMIALGFMGKEYVRWQREGRNVHIFNPSAFALGLFSLVLILTNTTHLTWGQEIASTLTLAPNIYAFLFLIGLIVMYFFSITLVAGMAAVSLFALSAVYSAASGVPYFLDSEIPAAVFLGLHLLITDPSTSPRTPLGKSLFGLLYGLGVFVLYTVLDSLGAPTFYDKLLCVPLLNLSVIAIDNAVRSINSRGLVNLWKESWLGGKANLAHMSVWIVVFASMAAIGKTDGKHTGDSLPFWQQACSDGLANACDRLVQLENTYCADNAAWACNELGVQYREGFLVEQDSELAFNYFSQSCELKFRAACVNLLSESSMLREDPHELDLRLMLREGGLNLMEHPLNDLYGRACDHNWTFACDIARGRL